MTATNPSGQTEKSPALKTFRPFLWAFLFIALLFGIRGHEYLSAHTSISFDVTLEGKPVPWEFEAECDGKRIMSASQLNIGNHQLAIRHPQGRTFTTNFFLFYGKHSLGRFDLKRQVGNLAITVDPIPQSLSIQGKELETNLTGVSEFVRTIPAGEYAVLARFLHSSDRRVVTVADGGTEVLRIAPHLGSLNIQSVESEASFRLMSQDGTPIANGIMPSLLSEIPVGEYKVTALHHNHARQTRAVVEKGKTNRVDIAFIYGALLIESQPEGAEIVSEENHTWGKTPMLIHEVEPGVKAFELRLESFQSAKVSLEAKPNQTNRASVKLVSIDFVRAVRDGKEARQKGDYDQAIACFLTALRAEPRDLELQSLLNDSRRSRGLSRAEKSGKSNDFKAAIVELEALAATFPNDEVVKRMLGEYRERENARRAAAEIDRSDRAKALFASLLRRIQDGDLFERNEIVTSMPLREAESEIGRVFRTDSPFKTVRYTENLTDAFKIEAEQEFRTALQTSAGKRMCFIIGAEIKKGETKIAFEVIEYGVEAVNKFSIGNAIGTPVAVKYIPLRETSNAPADDRVRTRIQEGIQIVKAKLSEALRQ